MKLFEVEFIYDDEKKRMSAGQTFHHVTNSFKVRIPFPTEEKYNDRNWSNNHWTIRQKFYEQYDPTTEDPRKYWIRKIKRVK